jgi:hypothetical protein
MVAEQLSIVSTPSDRLPKEGNIRRLLRTEEERIECVMKMKRIARLSFLPLDNLCRDG